MKTLTRGKAAVAGLLALGLALSAAPAFAAEGEGTLSVANDTFAAGSWGAGIEVTLSGIPAVATDVKISVSESRESSGSGIGEVSVVAEPDGTTYKSTIMPSVLPVAPNASDIPSYWVGATYNLPGVSEQVWVQGLKLTITGDPMTITGPATATVAQLSAGVELQFSGFQANEAVSGTILQFVSATSSYREIGEFSAEVGANGAGTGILTITGAQVGDEFKVNLYNSDFRFAGTYSVTATAAAPTKPERVETAA